MGPTVSKIKASFGFHQELGPEARVMVPDVQKDFVSPKMLKNSILAIISLRNFINTSM